MQRIGISNCRSVRTTDAEARRSSAFNSDIFSFKTFDLNVSDSEVPESEEVLRTLLTGTAISGVVASMEEKK